MLLSLMLGCSLIVNIVFVLVFYQMNDLINCYRNRIEDLILELIETHITIDKLKKTVMNEVVEESEATEEGVNENEAMFIDIVKLLDNTIDIAA